MTDSPAQRSEEGVWDRLRRRKVVQWGLVYVAAVWGFLQGLAYATATFHWPEQVQQLTTLALLIGLPIVLVLAWYHGDRGQQRISTPEFAILTLLLLLGGGAFWYYQRTSETATVSTPPPSTAAVTATDRSIAVLPFVNMSADKEQEYFADGIAEDLLNLLTKIPQLRVTSRSSAFSFKGQSLEIPEIGKRLNVAHILEGSVRKSGNNVRITVQLIDARADTQLWSETYDRTLEDIFAVQDHIAAAVVAQLKIKLLGGAPKARTTDPTAYALYLQARQLSHQRTAEGYEQSIALYQQVLAIDPNYAAAWVGLAHNYANQADAGMRPDEDGYRLAREAVEKALAIDPDFAAAHAELSWIVSGYEGDFAAAARHAEHALALEPANTDSMRIAAGVASDLGRRDTAIALLEYVTERDPVSARGHGMLGFVYIYAGRLDEAIASIRTALKLSPGYAGAHAHVGLALLLKGDYPGALTEIRKELSDYFRMAGLPMAWHSLGDKTMSDVALDELIRNHGKEAAYNTAYVLAWRGEPDRAFEWLDKAAAYHDPGLANLVDDPRLANLHKDPRWLPFLRKIGKAPEQLAAIKFDVKVPK